MLYALACLTNYYVTCSCSQVLGYLRGQGAHEHYITLVCGVTGYIQIKFPTQKHIYCVVQNNPSVEKPILETIRA